MRPHFHSMQDFHGFHGLNRFLLPAFITLLVGTLLTGCATPELRGTVDLGAAWATCRTPPSFFPVPAALLMCLAVTVV